MTDDRQPSGPTTIQGVVVSSHGSYQPTLPPPRPGLPGWLIALIATAASVVLVGILAAIAIPVFLNQRMKSQWQATTVSLPAGLNGEPRNTSSKALELAKTFANEEIPVANIAIYGTVGPKVVILLAVKLPAATSPDRQKAERAIFEDGFAGKGSALALTKDENPDQLGGWLGCGSTAEGVHVCLATDVASLVAVVTGPDAGDPVALTRQARDQAVIRH